MPPKISPQGKQEKMITLRNLTNLAEALSETGKLTEAEELYSTSVLGREKVLGKDHPETLVALQNYGLILEAKRKFQEAEIVYRECLTRRERLYGKLNPASCSTAFVLADMIRKLNRLNEAKELFEYAYQGFNENLGPKNHSTKQAKRRLKDIEKLRKHSCCIIQ